MRGTQWVNSVRSRVKSYGGERLPSCSTASFHKKASAAMDEALRPMLTPMLVSLETITAQLGVLDGQIEYYNRVLVPETARLQQVGGVGAVTALAFVATLDDPKRFQSSRSAVRAGAWVCAPDETRREMWTNSWALPSAVIRTCARCGFHVPTALWAYWVQTLVQTLICGAGGWLWPNAAERTPKSEPLSPWHANWRCCSMRFGAAVKTTWPWEPVGKYRQRHRD